MDDDDFLNNKFNMNISGKNNSQVIGNNNTISNSTSCVASYDAKDTSIITSAWSLIVRAAMTRLFPVIFLLMLIGGSIFYQLGLANADAHNKTTIPIYIYVNFIFNHPKALIFDVILILLLLVFGKLFWSGFENVIKILFRRPALSGGKYYKLNGDGSISYAKYTGDCPVPSCSGEITVRTPYDNEQDVKVAGICNRQRTHIFNFDPDTLKGEQIFLSPKKKSHKSSKDE